MPIILALPRPGQDFELEASLDYQDKNETKTILKTEKKNKKQT
jgi:hypothetical protein